MNLRHCFRAGWTCAADYGKLAPVAFVLCAIVGVSPSQAQDVIWNDYFSAYSVDEGISTRSSSLQSYTPANGKWTMTTVDCDYYKKTTSSGYLETRYASGLATWESAVITTSGYSDLEADIRIREEGDNESSGTWVDYYRVLVSYDEGTSYTEIAYASGNFGDDYLLLSLTSGPSVRLKIEFHNTSDEEFHRLYRVVLRGCTSATTWYEDADGDGLGDPNSTTSACSQPSGYVSDSSDTDPTVNNNDYNGTVLYPGDVYLSYGTDGKADAGSEQEVYVGFIVLKDVAEGTEIIVSPKLYWKDDKWNDEKKVEIRWTAPTGGVPAGTEVILFDVKDNANTGSAYRSATGNPIVPNGTQTQLTGGVSCGLFEHLGDEREDFKGKNVIWLFQPNTGWDPNDDSDELRDSKCRHLNCVGKNLDDKDNTGSGTLISGGDWNAQMSSNYSYQNSSIFNEETWAYNGGTVVGAFANSGTSLSSQSLAQGASFGADGATPSFDSDNENKDITIDPNGSLTLASETNWTDLVTSSLVTSTGSADLDITLDNDITLIVNQMGDGVACNDLSVSAGTFCACDSMGRTLKVNGDIALGASGAITGGTGRLQLQGSGAQTLDANNYSDAANERLRLRVLQVLNNKTATIKGHVKMQPAGALEFDSNATDDKLALNTEVSSSLTFQSSLSGTAAIGSCSADNFADGTSQQFTFERYIPADTDGSSWVNIGSYVTGTTVADWTAANAGMLVFKYEESNYGSLGSGWNYLWDGTTELTPGSGYMALIPQNQDALISVTGAFQIGDVNMDLTFTDDPNQSNTTVDGWNLISNPYPAPVNMTQVLDGTGISTWYIFDNATADAYVAGGSDANNILDVGQSAWIKVDAATTLTFSEEDKVTTTTGTFLREFSADYGGTIGLELSNASNNLGRAFVKFQSNTTAAFEPEHDALMYNSTGTADLGVWMTAESGVKLSRQAAGLQDEVTSIQLEVNSGAGGMTQFYAYHHPETPEFVCAVIEDTETGERAQLGRDTLEISLPANTHYADRFILHFTPEPSMTWESTACNGLDIALTGEAWESWGASWFALDGSANGTGIPSELEDGDYTFEFALPEAGCVQSVAVNVVTACLGDLNQDGERGVTDLLVVLAGLPGGTLQNDFAEQADCDCDGVVTVNDMLTFLTVFGTLCD